MHDRRPWHNSAHTVRADPTVAEQGRNGTDKPIVVKRLDDRHAMRGCCGIDRRRGRGKCVVHVHDLGTVGEDGGIDPTFRSARPDGRRSEVQVARERPGFAQVGIVKDDLVDVDPSPLQEPLLRLHHFVFAARQAIAGVDLQQALDGRVLAQAGTRCRGASFMTASPNPKMTQNQIPPCGPSRYGSKEVSTIIATQYARISPPSTATCVSPARRWATIARSSPTTKAPCNASQRSSPGTPILANTVIVLLWGERSE